MEIVVQKRIHPTTADDDKKVVPPRKPKVVERVQQEKHTQPEVEAVAEIHNVTAINDPESLVINFNKQVSENWRSVRFEVDQESEKIVVQVVDTTTNEVLKQIPGDEFFKLVMSFEPFRGVLVDEVS